MGHTTSPWLTTATAPSTKPKRHQGAKNHTETTTSDDVGMPAGPNEVMASWLGALAAAVSGSERTSCWRHGVVQNLLAQLSISGPLKNALEAEMSHFSPLKG